MANALKTLLAALTVLSIVACQTHTRPASTQPSPRTQSFDWMSLGQWYRLHGDIVDMAEHSRAEVLLVGDSITAGWPMAIWEEAFGHGKVANLGVGGDTTAQLLWRLDNGALGRLQPNTILLLIGTNNVGHNQEEPREVFLGVQATVRRLQTAFPETTILLHGLLPFDREPDSPNRALVQEVNQRLARLDNGHSVRYLDLGDVFLDESGRIPASLMADYLHPTPLGYERWAQQLLPLI